MSVSTGIALALIVLALGLVVVAWRVGVRREAARVQSGVIHAREEVSTAREDARRTEAGRSDVDAASEFDSNFGGGR